MATPEQLRNRTELIKQGLDNLSKLNFQGSKTFEVESMILLIQTLSLIADHLSRIEVDLEELSVH